ncbi:MAG: PepSY domain-containing protein [Pseudolabrys sp.]
MPVSRLFPTVFVPGLLALGLIAAPASAAESLHSACLTKAEQRAAVAGREAISLGQAIKARRARGHHAELVRARLCHHGGGLVYMLTLLGHSGKVIRETVDAANGEPINEH